MFRTLLLAAVFSINAGATSLVTKISATGNNVKPEYAKIQKCELTDTKIIITQIYGLAAGGVATAEREESVALDAGFPNLVRAAAQDPMTSDPNDQCGYPTTTLMTGDGAILYYTGGCGQPHQSRSGGATSAIMDFMNTFCPKNF